MKTCFLDMEARNYLNSACGYWMPYIILNSPYFLSFKEKVKLAYPDGVVNWDVHDLLFCIIVPGNLSNAFFFKKNSFKNYFYFSLAIIIIQAHLHISLKQHIFLKQHISLKQHECQNKCISCILAKITD